MEACLFIVLTCTPDAFAKKGTPFDTKDTTIFTELRRSILKECKKGDLKNFSALYSSALTKFNKSGDLEDKVLFYKMNAQILAIIDEYELSHQMATRAHRLARMLGQSDHELGKAEIWYAASCSGAGFLDSALLHCRKALKLVEGEQIRAIILRTQPLFQSTFEGLEVQLATTQEEKNRVEGQYKSISRAFVMTTSFLFLTLLSLTVISFYFNRKSQKARKEGELIKEKIDLMKIELDGLKAEALSRKRDLESFTAYLSILHNNDERVQQLLEMSLHSDEQKRRQYLRELSGTLKARKTIIKRHRVIFENIETISSDFYDRLKSKCPDLTASDMELCAYLRAGLGVNEIAELKFIESKSVYMNKYRLKKRLNLPADADITEFVHSL